MLWIDPACCCGFARYPPCARSDFNAFVRACEKYGRENIPQIAAEVDGKTEDEVREYAKVGALAGALLAARR